MNKFQYFIRFFLLAIAALLLSNLAIAADALTKDNPIPTRKERLHLPGMASINVTVAAAPVSGLEVPIIAINGTAANQQRQVNWGTSWKFSDIPPGTYLVTGVPITSGGQTYRVTPSTVTVAADATLNVTLAYTSGTSTTGQVTITLANAPSAQVPVTFTGSKQTINQSVTNGTVVTLPADTYTVSSSVANYTASASPNPITVPSQTALTITYTPVTTTGQVTVSLVNAPSATVPLTFTGQKQTLTHTVANGAVLTLPADTYSVTSSVPNYTATISPNPITVPTQTALSVTYSPITVDTGNRTIHFTNQCPYPVWFGFISGATVNRSGGAGCSSDADCHPGNVCVNRGGGGNHCFWKTPVPADGNFRLAPNGGKNSVKIPIFTGGLGAIWSGAVAGRTNCTSTGCETADCGGGAGACPAGRGFSQPATQAEFTFGKTSADFYNIEVINGMNLPLSMSAIASTPASDPYRCGSPGAETPRGSMGACAWNPVAPSNDYVWVKAGGAACTSDAGCAAGTKCGLSFNPGQSPAFRKTCGKQLGYWTANQVCGVSPTMGAPFNCRQTLMPPQGDLTLSNLYGCTRLGSCYSAGATSRCCGCTDWDKIGIPVPPAPTTTACRNTNPDWKPNVEPKLAWLKRACPSSYVYPFDDMSSTFVCQIMRDNNGTQVNVVDYNIVFCPGGATAGTQH